jgi:hypothetical protein
VAAVPPRFTVAPGTGLFVRVNHLAEHEARPFDWRRLRLLRLLRRLGGNAGGADEARTTRRVRDDAIVCMSLHLVVEWNLGL